MKYFTTLLLFCFCFPILLSQTNDNCQQAFSITTLDGNFEEYSFNNVSYDLINGTCSSSQSRNVWFKFIARGPKAIVSIRNNTDLSITALEMIQPCSVAGAVELACGKEQIVLQDLVKDSLYYIIIADDGFIGNSFDLSISNFEAPINDHPCEAIVIPSEGCVSGTTVGAQFNYVLPECSAFNSQNSLFYRYQMEPENRKLDLYFNNIEITGEMTIGLFVFPEGCGGNPFLAGATSFYCGIPLSHFSFDNLTPGALIYIMIGSGTVGAGSFSNMCLKENVGGDPCAQNINCNAAEDIPLNSLGTVCVIGCNEGMPDGDFAGCNNAFLNPTTWYKFNSGPNNTISFSVSGITLVSPSYVLMQNCTSVVECNPQISAVTPFTDYYIAITGAQGNVGSFELCITSHDLTARCIQEEKFNVVGTSMGSPLEGPYFPCEILTFSYETNFYAGGGCQWLHSVIPYLSDCWQDKTPQLTKYPVGTNSANFGWYPAGTVYWKPTTNNPVSSIGINDQDKLCLIGTSGCNPFQLGDGNCNSKAGTSMPAGWVATVLSGTCGSSDPNMSWGIAQGCNASALLNLEFQLEVPCNVCDTCDESGEGLVIGIASFTDGATGGYNNPQCNGNGLLKKKINVACCVPPAIIVFGDTLCHSGVIEKNFSLTDTASMLEWILLSADGISGAGSGQGNTFIQDLSNNTTGVKIASYNVRAVNTLDCNSSFKLYNITVFPTIRTHLVKEIYACAVNEILLQPDPSGGSGGPYYYSWSGGSSADELTVNLSNDTTIYLTVTDSLGCSVNDTINIYFIAADTIELPDNKELSGKLIFESNEDVSFSVNDFQNASGYFWTLDGMLIGNEKELNFNFENVAQGSYELCVFATNCLNDTLHLCYDILILDEYSNADCLGAQEVCSKEYNTFNYEGNFGNIQELGNNNLCDFGSEEFFTHWITWDIKQAGKLWFTIYTQSNEDLDFVVYKAHDDCDSIESIRCAFAKCPGNTGLNAQENDEIEGPGCDQGQNNFLKAIDCQVGEKYYLMVNNYSNQQNSFGLEFCGNALMSCDSVVCVTTATDMTDHKADFKVYPNPGDGKITIQSSAKENISVEIFDVVGRIIHKQALSRKDATHIELNHSQPGMYFILYKNLSGHIIGHDKLIIQ